MNSRNPLFHSQSAQVFWTFLKLGLSSFGGPWAHVGYFHAEFVKQKKWLDDRSFTELVSLCQFLPGPASSQLGIAIGWQRAGLSGSILAWIGFTLPSTLVMILFAYGFAFSAPVVGQHWLHGLKITAVSFVAHALWSMGKPLLKHPSRILIALSSALILSLAKGMAIQFAIIAAAAILGICFGKQENTPREAVPLRSGEDRHGAYLFAFLVLLIALPLSHRYFDLPALKLMDAFYRAGALVFGGGHVVLPLLQSSTVESGLVTQNHFIAGYSLAQGLPGPLFAFAGFLGAAAQGPLSGWLGGTIALLGIFLPGFLLVLGGLPYWETLRDKPKAQAAMATINASVVGILLAAFYDPVMISAIHGPWELVLACLGFIALASGKVSPLSVLASIFGLAMILL